MDKPSFSASSTMRHCLVITSCPPVLAMCVVMLLGLVLLLVDISLVPKFHYSPTLAEREIPEDVPTDVIFGKRISKIWKVEDFIVRKRAGWQSRTRRKQNVDARFKTQSRSVLDQVMAISREPVDPSNRTDDHKREGHRRKQANVVFDKFMNLGSKNEDRKDKGPLSGQTNNVIFDKRSNLENNTGNNSQEKEIIFSFKEPRRFNETNRPQMENLHREAEVVSFNILKDSRNDTKDSSNIQTNGSSSLSHNQSLSTVVNKTTTINDSVISLKKTKNKQTLLSGLPETKNSQSILPIVSKSEKSNLKEKKQTSSTDIQRKTLEIRRKSNMIRAKTRRENRRGRVTNLGDDNSYFVTSTKHRSKLHDRMVNQFKLRDGAQRDTFINLHRYGYVFDSQACSTGNPKFAILIHSKFSNFVKRAKIRNTFAKNKTASGIRFAVTFILGKPNIDSLVDRNSREISEMKREELEKFKRRKYNETMHSLETESRIFKDIVMGNFTDTYRNLTIKHILAYHWLLKRCKGPGFVLKVDDDILVNTYRIARLVKQAARSSESRGLLICDVPEGQKVIRSNSNKWFVSEQEYPFRFYPPWCKGYGVFMTRDVVKKLYLASSDIRDFWIDDVYVTGILAWRAGIQVRNFRQKHATVTHNQFEQNDIHAMFIWTRFNKRHSHRMYWKALSAAQENL